MEYELVNCYSNYFNIIRDLIQIRNNNCLLVSEWACLDLSLHLDELWSGEQLRDTVAEWHWGADTR